MRYFANRFRKSYQRQPSLFTKKVVANRFICWRYFYESMHPKIVCLVPCLPEDYDPKSISSVRHQTVPVDAVIVLSARYIGGTLASRVSRVLNDGLRNLDLRSFDYLLRVDCDTVLSDDFLEHALNKNCDLYGGWGGMGGGTMLIKVAPFLKLMGGRFNSESDDTPLIHKFEVSGCKVLTSSDDSHVHRRIRRHDKADYLQSGVIYYKVGYEPFHVLGFLRKLSLVNFFVVCGYIIAFLRQTRKFDFAREVWRFQISRVPVMVAGWAGSSIR